MVGGVGGAVCTGTAGDGVTDEEMELLHPAPNNVRPIIMTRRGRFISGIG